MLDGRSLVIGYDGARGEPRGKLHSAAKIGDCVACDACVATCPTGIDIRDGLQMECIGCAQCIDACDAIMDRVGRPRGLIRYGSQDGFAGRPGAILRPRTIIYPLILAAIAAAFVALLLLRAPADVTLLRGVGAPFAILPSGEVSSQLRLKIANRTDAAQSFEIDLDGADGARLTAPQNPLPVPVGETATETVFVIAPRAAFRRGTCDVRVRLRDVSGTTLERPWRLLGPETEN
jgi:cytochrome c oxidase accessory protein FixG